MAATGAWGAGRGRGSGPVVRSPNLSAVRPESSSQPGSAVSSPKTNPVDAVRSNTSSRSTSPKVVPNTAEAAAAHDLLLFIMASLIGQKVVVCTSDGRAFRGLLRGASGDGLSVAIAYAQPDPLGDNPPAPVTMVFLAKDVVAISAADVDVARLAGGGAAATFETDTGISGGRLGGGRNLVKWEPGATDLPPSAGSDLDGPRGGTWDQFEANQRLFDVKPTFDEDHYTTRLDRSGADFQARSAAAQRQADAILRSSAENVHVREDRGTAPLQDEEDLFSAVSRTGAGRGRSVNGSLPGSPNVRPPPAQPSRAAVAPMEDTLGNLVKDVGTFTQNETQRAKELKLQKIEEDKNSLKRDAQKFSEKIAQGSKAASPAVVPAPSAPTAAADTTAPTTSAPSAPAPTSASGSASSEGGSSTPSATAKTESASRQRTKFDMSNVKDFVPTQPTSQPQPQPQPHPVTFLPRGPFIPAPYMPAPPMEGYYDYPQMPPGPYPPYVPMPMPIPFFPQPEVFPVPFRPHGYHPRPHQGGPHH